MTKAKVSKLVLCTILILVLIASCCVLAILPTTNAHAVTVANGIWTSFAATGFAGGSGTVADPYLIATAEQLALLAKKTRVSEVGFFDASYKLTSDIDLSAHNWDPIGFDDGTTTFWFKGNFNGDNHIISGLVLDSNYTNNPNSDKTYGGLFGCVNLGTLENFTIKDAVVKNNGDDPNVSYHGWINTGILSGWVYNSTIKNIAVIGGSAQFRWWCSPFISTLEYSNVDNCIVKDVVATATDWTFGGLATNVKNSTIKNSHVQGATFKSITPTWEARCGGLVGQIYDSTIDGCSFNGTIDAVHNFVGGIVGYNVNNATVIIKNTNVYGNIKGQTYVGGIFGGQKDTLWAGTVIENCINFANISATGSDVGGIAGNADNKMIITQCANVGEVSGGANVGDILGSGTAIYSTEPVLTEITSMSQGQKADVILQSLNNNTIKGKMEIYVAPTFDITFASVPDFDIFIDGVKKVKDIDYTIVGNKLSINLPQSSGHRLALVTTTKYTDATNTTLNSNLRASYIFDIGDFAVMPTINVTNAGSTFLLNNNNNANIINYNDGNANKTFDLKVGDLAAGVTLSITLSNGANAQTYFDALTNTYKFKGFKENVTVAVKASQASKVDKILRFTLIFNEFSEGLGTAVKPYIITQPLQFLKMKGDMYYQLGSDIDFAGVTDWQYTTIGRFVLDGANHKIKNFGVNKYLANGFTWTALFGDIYGKSIIKNLYFENANFVNELSNNVETSVLVGCIGDTTNHETDITFDNVHIDVIAKGAYNFGAFYTRTYGSNVTFNNCSVNAKVDGINSNGAFGGFVAACNKYDYATVYTKITFDNCIFNGTMSNAEKIGGFIGETSGSRIVITNSKAMGVIKDARSCAAGFIGTTDITSSYNIINTINFADISANNTDSFTGAIIGQNATKNGYIANVTNAGILTGKGANGLIGNENTYLPEQSAENLYFSVSNADGEVVIYKDTYSNVVKYLKYNFAGTIASVTITLTKPGQFELYIDGKLATLGVEYTVSGNDIIVKVKGCQRMSVIFSSADSLKPQDSVFIYELFLAVVCPTYELQIDGGTKQTIINDGKIVLEKNTTTNYVFSYDTTNITNEIVVKVDGQVVTPTINGALRSFALNGLTNTKKVITITTVSSNPNFLDNVFNFTIETKYNVDVKSSNNAFGSITGNFSSVMSHGDVVALTANPIDSLFEGWYQDFGKPTAKLLSKEKNYSFALTGDICVVGVFKLLTEMPAVSLTSNEVTNLNINGNVRLIQMLGTTSNYVFNFASVPIGTTVYALIGATRYDLVGNKVTIPNIANDCVIKLIATNSSVETVDKVFDITISLLNIFPIGLVANNGNITNSQIVNDAAYPFEHDKTVANKVAYKSINKAHGYSGIKINFNQVGVFTFDYRVNTTSGTTYFMEILLNGNRVQTFTGDTGWQTYSIYIPNNNNTVEIRYVRYSSSAAQGDDAIWVANFALSQLQTTGDGSVTTAPLTLNNIEDLLTKVKVGAKYYVFNNDILAQQFVKLTLGATYELSQIVCPQGTTYTVANGIYAFSGLKAGDNVVRFEFKNGASFDLNISNKGLAGYPNITIGRGTQDQPYIISDFADINALREYTDKFFKLADSMTYTGGTIDVASKTININSWTPIGTSAKPFSGGFDGNNWKLVITSSIGGLFGFVTNANISNLILDVTCTGNSTGALGALIGAARGTTVVNNVAATARFDIISSAMGGLVGESDTNVQFNNCIVYGTIKNNSTGNTGGLAGNGGTFRDCIVYADVSGSMLVGGLFGGYQTTGKCFNTSFAGTVSITGDHGNNYPYFGYLNGYGAWVSFEYNNSGVLLTLKYNNASSVTSVDIFNSEFGATLISSVNGANDTITKTFKLNLKSTFADMGLLSETLINGVTGNYGGFVVRFSMNDGAFKYVSTMDRANAKFLTNMDIDLSGLTSYVDNFANMTIDTSKGITTYKTEAVGTKSVSIFGTVNVANANDFEHLQWIINGGIPTTFDKTNNGGAGYYYNERSVATLSLNLTADIDLTADRLNGSVYLNRVGGRLAGDKIYQFYGFGVSEMHPYRGSIYGNNHTLTVNMNFPKAYLMGIIAMSSEQNYQVVINNLTVAGTIIGGYRVGIVGMYDAYYRSGTLLFDNVTNALSKMGANTHVGGLLGVAHAIPNVTIKNCTIKPTELYGKQRGAFVGSVGNWSLNSTIFYNGTNNNYTLMAPQSDTSYLVANANSDKTITRVIKVHYGQGANEFVTLQTADSTVKALTMSSITVGGATYNFAQQTFTFDDGAGNLTRDFYIFVLKGNVSKEYDANANFALTADNYLGTWDNITGNVTASSANYNATQYTELTHNLVVKGSPRIIDSGITATINQRQVTIGFSNDVGLIYNGLAQSITVTGNNFVGIENEANKLLTITGNSRKDVTPNGSTQLVSVALIPTATNYVITGNTTKHFTIAKYALAVAFPTDYTTTKTYGNAEPTWANKEFVGANSEKVMVSFARKTNIQAVGKLTNEVAVSTANGNYTVELSSAVDFTINKATPTVSLADKTVTYNGSSITIGNASVTGVSGMTAPTGEVTYMYYTDSTCTNVITTPLTNVGVYYVKATIPADGNYITATSNVATLTIKKATPTFSSQPTASGICVGQTLAASQLTGGVANVAGTFAWKDSAIAPKATATHAWVFTPTDTTNYISVEGTASVTVTQLTVTFNDCGIDRVVNVDYGSTLAVGSFPIVTAREYYTAEWDTKTALTNITVNKTVTAKYTVITYNIDYVLDGGTVVGNPITYNVETPNFTLNNPTKLGYTFAGWTGTQSPTANKEVTIAQGSNGNRAYTATWTINSYTLTISTANGSVTGFISGNSVEFNKPITLTFAANAGYKLGSVTVNGIQVAITNNTYTFNMPAQNTTVVVEFVAQDKIQYTVNHYKQNIINNEYTLVEKDTQTLYGKTATMTKATAYTYDGFTAQTFADIAIAGDGTTVVNIYYTRNSYNVTFDGATAVSYKFGDTVTLTTPTKPGFTFAYWASNIDAVQHKGTYTMTASAVAFTSVWTLDAPTVNISGYTLPVIYGTPVTLTANGAHVLSGLTYQWYKDNQIISGANSSMIQLTNVSDSGTYKVVVSLTVGGQTKTAESVQEVVINKATMTVTSAAYNSQYDGADHCITVTAPSGSTIEYSLDNITWSTTNPMFNKVTETTTVYYRVTMTNYETVTNNATVTITQRQVTVKAVDQSSIYNGQEPTLDGKKYQLVGNFIATDNVTITLTKVAGIIVGSYAINPTTNANSDYLVVLQPANFEITKRQVTVKAVDQSSIYNGQEPTLDSTKYQLVGDFIAADNVTITLTKVAGTTVGIYVIKPTTNANTNYEVTILNGQFDITKRQVTVTPGAQEFTYTGKVPALTTKNMWNITTGSLIVGDNLDIVLSGQPNVVAAGTYTIVCTFTNNNYNVTFVKASYTIKPIDLIVTIGDSQSEYSKTADLTSTIKGNVVPGETPQYTLAVYNKLVEVDRATADVGEYTINGIDNDNNYNITFVVGKYTVVALPVDVSGIKIEDAVNGIVTIGQADGNKHYVVAIKVPTGVTVNYTCDTGAIFEGIINGQQKVCVSFTASNNNYILTNNNPIEVYIAVIKKTITITWTLDDTYTFNGASQSSSVKATYEDENKNTVELTYANKGLTFTNAKGEVVDFVNAGIYTATLNIDIEYNIDSASTKTQKVTMQQASIDVSQVKYEVKNVFYNGEIHKHQVTNLPQHVTVQYKYNNEVFDGISEIGIYNLAALLTPEDDNYKLVGDNQLNSLLTIVADTNGQKAFTDKVDSIGIVNLDSFDAIKIALTLYDALSDKKAAEASKAKLDKMVVEYNTIVKQLNEQQEVSKTIAQRAVASSVVSFAILLQLLALGLIKFVL